MTRWLVLSTVVAATALGGCRDRDRNPNSVPPPSAMPVEQTDTAPGTTAPRDTPATAGTATANDPWAQAATPSSAGTPSPSAGSSDPWARPATPPNANPTPPQATPESTPPAESTPSREATPNAASPTLPFPPPGTAGKTIEPARNVKPDEPGAIDQDAPGDAGVSATAGSGNRDFGRP